MRTLSLIFLILFLNTYLFAGSGYDRMPEYYLDSVVENAELGQNTARVVVTIRNSQFQEGEPFLYGYGDLGFEGSLDEFNTFSFDMEAGTFQFQFYLPEQKRLAEITSYPFEVREGTITYLSLYFQAQYTPEKAIRKPVIYLYPDEKTAVSVKVLPSGKMSFTYPDYSDSWEFIADPSGDLHFGDQIYNYLFWESEQHISSSDLDLTSGSIVSKSDLLSFLETNLDQFGFSSKEKADFITFWAPQMMRNEACFVQFKLNGECALFADLQIEPTPDNLLRFYMVWSPIDSNTERPKLKPQKIERQIREGFTVLEWGGVEIPMEERLVMIRN